MKKSSFMAELKFLLSNRKVLISVCAVALVPVLYAAMFIWAFWDPYANLGDLPVAIVNEDEGADFEGESLQVGKELAEKLGDSDQFNFQVVSKEEGYKGLENRDYYLLVEIPKNFSANATTILDDEPKKLELKYVPNESTNFLSSQIGETAMKEIKAEISKNIIATYSETMFDSISKIADGLSQASDGTNQVKDGIAQLNDGSKTLSENLATLASKSIVFKNGVNSAAEGSDSLADGSSQIKSGLEELNNNLPKLVDGTSQIEAGVEKMKNQLPSSVANGISKELSSSIPEISNGIDTLNSQLTTSIQSGITNGLNSQETVLLTVVKNALMNNGYTEVQADAFVAEVKNNATYMEKQSFIENSLNTSVGAGINNGLSQLETSLTSKLSSASAGIEEKLKKQTDPNFDQLLAGINGIKTGQLAVQNGVNKLYNGSVALSNGASELSSGMSQLSSGASQLKDGAGKLADGSTQLKSGTDKLLDGSNELAEKLAEGAESASSVKADENTYDMMGEPVKVEKEAVNEVPNYGTGFSPYFISLGLFVGALMITIIYELKTPVIRPKNAFTWFGSKFGILAIVGIIQALLVDAILLIVLKLDVANLPLFILTSVIVSFVFMTLIQMLVVLLGDPGRFIAIIILILQLTTSAGTFPMELLPKALQHFTSLLPMTYTIQAFKSSISSGDISFLWHNIFILIGYMVVFMLITIGYLAVSMKRNQDAEIAAKMGTK